MTALLNRAGDEPDSLLRRTKKSVLLMRIVTAIIALVMFVSVLGAQEQHVHRAYDRSARVTRLKSDYLILLNSPDQYLELQLVAAWPGEARQGPPQRIFMELISRTLKPIYRESDPAFSVLADSTTIDFGPLSTYNRHQQVARNIPDIYDSLRDEVARIPIPITAAVIAANAGALLTAEVLHSQDISPDQIANLARAGRLALKLDASIINLTDDQVTFFRNFEQSLLKSDEALGIAPGESSAEPELPDAPLDTSSASLQRTLNWLKGQLARNGRITRPGSLTTTQFEEISGCSVTVSVNRPSEDAREDYAILYPSVQYRIDLADLNPESASLSGSKGFATIRVATHDSKYSIPVVVKQQVTGKANERKATDYIEITMSSLSAHQIREAMVHAIKLCHARP